MCNDVMITTKGYYDVLHSELFVLHDLFHLPLAITLQHYVIL